MFVDIFLFPFRPTATPIDHSAVTKSRSRMRTAAPRPSQPGEVGGRDICKTFSLWTEKTDIVDYNFKIKV